MRRKGLTGSALFPRVFNQRRRDEVPSGAVYVGRPTKWGNPFEIGKDGTREEVITKYKVWLVAERPDLILAAQQQLKGRDLVCWCAPEACHADVLIAIANLHD